LNASGVETRTLGGNYQQVFCVNVRYRTDLVPASRAGRGSAIKKEWTSEPSSSAISFISSNGTSSSHSLDKPINATAAFDDPPPQSARGWNAFRQVHCRTLIGPVVFAKQQGCLNDQIPFICRDAFVWASKLNSITLTESNVIVQGNGLENRKQLVKAVIPPAEDTQHQIDLGERRQGKRIHRNRIKQKPLTFLKVESLLRR
jgi:hypothetical protein